MMAFKVGHGGEGGECAQGGSRSAACVTERLGDWRLGMTPTGRPRLAVREREGEVSWAMAGCWPGWAE